MVELLVVIAIIATLAAIGVPAYSSILRKMKVTQAEVLAGQIQNSIKNYYVEYQKYPLPEGGGGGEVTPLMSDELIVNTLLGRDPVTNPKKIAFLPELKEVGPEGVYGLKTQGEGAIIVDPWGMEYNIIMDADYSSDVDNPNPASGSPKLYQTVLVWSSGPDKDAATWEDNVATWTKGKSADTRAPKPTQ